MKNSETDTESTDTDSDAAPEQQQQDMVVVKNHLSLLAEALDHEVSTSFLSLQY